MAARPLSEAATALAGRPAAPTALLLALVVGLTLSISLAQIALGALTAWVLLTRRRAMAPPPLRLPLLAPIAAFAVWSVVSALASARPLESLVFTKSVLNLAALFVVVNTLPDAALARRFATWLLVALTAAAALGLLQVAACPGPEATAHAATLVGSFLRKCTRARGFYSIYMTLAGVLAMLLTSMLPRLARLGRDARWLGAAWVLGGAALGLTYVRGAWLAFAAGALAVVAGLGRRGLVAAVALALLAVLVISLPGVSARLKTIGDASDDTTRDRLAMLAAGKRLAAEHPVAGVGPGQLKHVYPLVATSEAMRRATSHVHNTPLQIAAERGVVGLAAWLWIFVAFLVRGTRLLRGLPREAAADRAIVLGSLAAIVTFLVAGLFEYNYGDAEVLLVAVTLMALPFAIVRDHPAGGAWT